MIYTVKECVHLASTTNVSLSHIHKPMSIFFNSLPICGYTKPSFYFMFDYLFMALEAIIIAIIIAIIVMVMFRYYQKNKKKKTLRK